MNFSRFRKKTPRQIHRIKYHAICINICGEINEQNLDGKFDHEEREFDEISKN